MAIFRRLKDLEVLRVESVYGPAGLLDRRVVVGASTMVRAGRAAQAATLSILEADNLLMSLRENREREQALARRETRLPEARRRASWGQMTPEEKRLLVMSQKEYNLFRAQQGTQAGAQAPPAGREQVTAPTAAGAVGGGTTVSPPRARAAGFAAAGSSRPASQLSQASAPAH
jgi:hypothetical protein